jgi:hypothetical protein
LEGISASRKKRIEVSQQKEFEGILTIKKNGRKTSTKKSWETFLLQQK